MHVCLERAWGNVRLYLETTKQRVNGIRGFTLANMHAAKGAFAWLGCKGSDTIVLTKWLRFFVRMEMLQPHWSRVDQQVFRWIEEGCTSGLAFSQGIHGHSLWLPLGCAKFLRDAIQSFGNAYCLLAHYCWGKQYNLFAMIPKLHALMHIRLDLHHAVESGRVALNPGSFDCSMSEDYIGRIARSSRRISYRNLERSIILAWSVKCKCMIRRFRKSRGF